MTTTELTQPPRASSPPRHVRRDESADRTVGEILDETVPLVGVIPLHGPPVLLLAGPWLLLALIVAGPFAVLFTFVVLIAAAVALVGLIAAILAAPFVVARRLRSVRAARASMRVKPAPLVLGESRWGAA